MAKLAFKNGLTSIILRVFIPDITSVIGGGKTGLTFSSSGLIISTIADNEATPTNYTQAGSTIETISTLGTFAAPTATKCRFKEVDSVNMPGIYEIQIADARWAVSNARSIIISLPPVSGLGMGPVRAEIQLTAVDFQDATAFGLSRLDATISSRSTYAGADTAGTTTLLSRIASALTITGGKVDVNDKTGFSLSSGGVQAIWDALTSALTTSGSIGKWIVEKLDVVLSTRLASSAYTTPLDGAGVRTAMGLGSANLDTQLSNINAKTINLPPSPASEGNVTNVGNAVVTVSGQVTNVQADVDDVQIRLPAALVGGKMDSAVDLTDITNAILAMMIENGLTFQECMLAINAACFGLANGGGTNLMHFLSQDGLKNRITVSVDADGNRTAMTLDLS